MEQRGRQDLSSLPGRAGVLPGRERFLPGSAGFQPAKVKTGRQEAGAPRRRRKTGGQEAFPGSVGFQPAKVKTGRQEACAPRRRRETGRPGTHPAALRHPSEEGMVFCGLEAHKKQQARCRRAQGGKGGEGRTEHKIKPDTEAGL